MLKFFLGGIIQGSNRDDDVHRQDYRAQLRSILLDAFPDAEVYCPIEHHPNSLAYSDMRAREVFFAHVTMCAETDVLVAYLPEASMGTAVEMWAAHNAGRVVVAISPLVTNWVVKLLSDTVCSDIDAFGRFVGDGRLQGLLERKANARL